jgi:hypothetical protein
MRYLLSTAGTLLVMLSLGASLDPALAKSKRETAALLEAKVTLPDAVSVAQKKIPGGKAVDADLVSTRNGKVIYSIELTKDDAYIPHSRRARLCAPPPGGWATCLDRRRRSLLRAIEGFATAPALGGRQIA